MRLNPDQLYQPSDLARRGELLCFTATVCCERFSMPFAGHIVPVNDGQAIFPSADRRHEYTLRNNHPASERQIQQQTRAFGIGATIGESMCLESGGQTRNRTEDTMATRNVGFSAYSRGDSGRFMPCGEAEWQRNGKGGAA